MKPTPNKPTTKRGGLFYTLLLLLGVLTFWGLSSLSSSRSGNAVSESLSLSGQIGHSFDTFLFFVHEHLSSQFGLLLIQIIAILLFARLVAWLFVKIGQPSVIGEILSGIILGPSVLGMLFPTAFNALFPSDSLYNISLLSQFGLILFMFVIGMELDLSEIKKRLKTTFIISHAGIVIPFILGAITAVLLFDDYGAEDGDLLSFSLFIGISMSITAFPVLARIIQEKGMMNSHIGIISLASAANGDITAWCLVAVIMAIAQAGSAMSALFTILFAGGYMLIMFFVVRPIFRSIGRLYTNPEVLTKGVISVIFLTLLISAYVTEILGLHALFGSFIAGVVMPQNSQFRRLLTEKVEDVSLTIFLPLFFVSSGLQTEIGLLNTPAHWWITLLITTIAVIGKLGGTYLSARIVGETRYDSLYMGILMNTRGLMELVILSMGYQLGILSPVIYAMLVLMTLVTTFMTTPLINLLNKVAKHHEDPSALSHAIRILFSFGRRSTGVLMLNLVHTFFPDKGKGAKVTAMHMTVGAEVNPLQASLFRENSFSPLMEVSKQKDIPVVERYEITDNPVQCVVNAANTSHTDLLLVGAPIELSPTTLNNATQQSRNLVDRVGASTLFNLPQLLRDKTKAFITYTNASVGIVIDRGLNQPASRICVVYDTNDLDVRPYTHLVDGLLQHCTIPCDSYTIGDTDHLAIGAQPLSPAEFTSDFLSRYDLLLIPYETFRGLSALKPEVLEAIPTSLLLQSRQTEPFPSLSRR